MIDPETLERQREMVSAERSKRREFRCPKCHRRTRDKAGVCLFCRREASMPNPVDLSNDALMSHLRACIAELQRRQGLIGEAVSEGANAIREYRQPEAA